MKNLLLLYVCLLTACCTSMSTVPQYSFVFTNATGAELRQVRCQNESGFHASAGYLAPDPAKAAHDELIPDPIPGEVTVTWQTADGQNHSQQIAIKSQLPVNFSGEVVLTFTPDGKVVVSHQPFFEMPK
ncbi:MAG TPA: hypothetical protein VHC95_12675 [Opitutales bacterium]|nr:hypothetical protein [Opitutales bacterium]